MHFSKLTSQTMLVIAVFVATRGASARQQYDSQPRAARQAIEPAAQLPVEYRADIQLGILESPRRISPALRSRTLEGLFEDADSAQRPFKVRDITGDNYARSRSLERASVLGLDTLSIQMRVVQVAMQTNPNRSLELFESVRLKVPTVGCKSPVVYDVSDYYQVLARLLQRGFPKPRKAYREHISLLERHFADVTSPLQLALMAGVLTRLEADRDTLARLTMQYADVLRKTEATDRELGFATGRLTSSDTRVAARLLKVRNEFSLPSAIGQLAARHGSNTPEAIELLRAYREFLVRNSRSPACADITKANENIVAEFNALSERHARGAVPSLLAKELESNAVGSAARIEEIPNAAAISRGLLRKLIGLREVAAKGGGTPADVEPSIDDEINKLILEGWEADASELLQRADAIQSDIAPCAACVFYQKVELLMALFDLCPPGSTKARILDHLVDFLSRTSLKDTSRVEWLYKFRLLLNLSRAVASHDAKRISDLQREGKVLLFLPDANSRELILQAISTQQDPIMSQYLDFERVVRPTYTMPPYR